MTATYTGTLNGGTVTYYWNAFQTGSYGALNSFPSESGYNSSNTYYAGIPRTSSTNSVTGTAPQGNTGTKYFAVKIIVSKAGCDDVEKKISTAVSATVSSCT